MAFLLLLLVLSYFITIQWWYFLVLLGVRFLFLLIGSSFIQLNFHVKAYCNNPNEKEKKIALTFDDGPNLITPQILTLLKQYNAKATFFCIGKNIEKHPKILKKTFEEGHIIGNHSFSHSHFFDFYRKEKVIAELQQTDVIIEQIIGKKPAFFRPPYGVTNPSIRRALATTNHKVIGWNIRSMDGIIQNKKIIFNRISSRITPGAIVLLHDTSENTVSVLEQLLLFLQSNNYQVVSLEELLNLKAYED
ncbi:MAG: polysaccharide deacetylase family protein [Bacteroidota bacterium]